MADLKDTVIATSAGSGLAGIMKAQRNPVLLVWWGPLVGALLYLWVVSGYDYTPFATPEINWETNRTIEMPEQAREWMIGGIAKPILFWFSALGLYCIRRLFINLLGDKAVQRETVKGCHRGKNIAESSRAGLEPGASSITPSSNMHIPPMIRPM